MTDHQIELMKHAIGFPKMYRNYFAAGEKDEKDWEELVALGMAKKHINYPNDFYPYPIYTVSPKGIDFLWSMKNGS